MKYDFDKSIDRWNTHSIKYNAELLKQWQGIEVNPDTIMMWVADMDLPCPQPVIEAIEKRAAKAIFGYTTHYFSEEYYNAVTGWFKNRYAWSIKKDDIVFSPSVVGALNHLIKILSREGEGVIIQRPVYPPFTRVIKQNNRHVVVNELKNEAGYFTIDYDDLQEKASDLNNKLMILCNPHNPVGRVWTEEELVKIMEICEHNAVDLIVDEIHCDLIRRNAKHIPIHTISNNDSIVACTATNKTFNTAGLHCANIIIRNKLLRTRFEHSLGMSSPSSFSIEAMIAGYNEGADWLDQLTDYLDENFDYLEKFVAEHLPKVIFKKSEGTYLAWLDFRAYDMTEEQCYRVLVEKANVVPQKGSEFGEEGTGFLRFNLAMPRKTLVEACNRVEKAMIDR